MKPDEIIAWGERFAIPVSNDLTSYPFVVMRLQKIPYSFAKHKQMLPLDEQNGEILVAIADPFDFQSLEEIRCLLASPIREILATGQAIENAIEACYHQSETATSELIATLTTPTSEKKEDEEEGYDLLEHQSDSPVIRMLNALLIEAIQQGASDIHFEPVEQGMSIRYRIDGVLQQRHAPPKEFQPQLITRIKVMSRLDIAEHRLPQDGRIKLRLGGRQIDFRVSTVPVVYGERIVLRILDKSNISLGLNRIGMPPDLLEAFQKLTHFSEGILLVTGPTGSGKTTTLYSAITEINSSEMNIMTIEDPVEYKLQGMAQIGVNPKINLTFATGLRHILRQDPDVIMIGEIRDKETAEIAIQASLTGHLVLSTLHTNDAPSALTRLIDMGIEPYLLSSSVIGVLAQRLVRKICPQCRIDYPPSDREKIDLGVPNATTPFSKGTGCPHCFGSGYKGRHGIYELMPIDPTIKQQMLKSGDSLELQKTALVQGMKTLRKQGCDLVIQGITTSSEVIRVTRF